MPYHNQYRVHRSLSAWVPLSPVANRFQWNFAFKKIFIFILNQSEFNASFIFYFNNYIIY